MTEQKKQILLNTLKYALIIFAFASVILFFYQCIRNSNKFTHIDLTSYIRASVWFFSGENPYQDVARRFIYPQFLLIVVAPFHSVLDSPLLRGITAGIWAGGLYLAFFLTLGASWKGLYGYDNIKDSLRKNILTIALIVLIVYPLLQDEFLNGQVNLFVMGSTAAFFLFLEKKRLFWASFFLAVATSIKIAPGFCLLYILFSRQYRVLYYFFPLLFLFVFGLPQLINDNSLAYYRYFVTDVMPHITGSDFEGKFRSFSIISTLSYLFDIHWYSPLKILAIGSLSMGLFYPIFRLSRQSFSGSSFQFRLTVFGAMASILPLTFPMSEPHHLLLQIIPILAIVAYLQSVVSRQGILLKDKLSLLFIVCFLGLQIGHGLKDTPIRLLCLIAIYIGMIFLLKKLGAGEGIEPKQGGTGQQPSSRLAES